MYGTNTTTGTYTVLDVRKTFEGCEADLRTIARRTRKWTMDYVDEVFHDILKLAENDYLKTIDIALVDNNSTNVRKASKFVINAQGTATQSERAGGNNDWSDIPNTHLTVILSYTDKWARLSDAEKKQFQQQQGFKRTWSTTSIDNSFPHLNSINAQLYGSKGYELQKSNYN